VRLETERLVLREMRADDAEPLLSLFGDPRFMAAFDTPPFDRAAMDRWVARNLAHQRKHGYGLFTIEEKATSTVIGDCGLELIDVGAELGYDLRADRWGRGLATEAATAVRDLAIGALALPRVVSLIRVGNAASRRVAEKIGMRLAEETTRGSVRYWLYELQPLPPSPREASPRPSR
jgi:ribosomal-protein-alanine N-acetyltransferase